AIERNPTDEASRTLAAALDAATSPAWGIAIANAIGSRREPGAAGALAKRVRDPDDGVAAAVILALGQNGSARAAEILARELARAPIARRALIERACLLCADHLVRAGAAETARSLFQAVLDSTAIPLYRESSRRGLQRCRP
ncbi:MAG: HEAT repeat domain-containing protein, partial [Planctomycetes bacterium]|nr:HEAT repeat domain-containing protein [Planctomycetota bacterium]